MALDFHLAQVNVARAVAPLDGPELADFMSSLDPINELADNSPGFVWRLQDDSGNATGIRPFEDDRIMVNMSVWESVDALYEFVYRSHHVDYFRRRREWFERFESTYMALWWIPAGTIPSTDDAWARLKRLDTDGPSDYAFTFKQTFPPPAVAAAS